ncbi:MAG: hypothetical protein HY331_07590 [Chloroflexi bacterium]|nr:hypothetical protein [Chloroflexota bacterium]
MVKPSLLLVVRTAVVLVFGLSLLAGLLDHHAVERVPWHDHLVLDAGGVLPAGRVSHRHGYEYAHAHTPTGSPTSSLDTRLAVTAFELAPPADGGLGRWPLGMAERPGSPPSLLSGRIPPPVFGGFAEVILPLPDKPPIAR